MSNISTPEAIAKRFDEIMDTFFTADADEQAAMNAEYDELVKLAKQHHGEDAPVHLTDPELAQLYSDLYKDENGCRPSLTCSQAHARAYCNRFRVE